ncbi:Adaptin N terminal region family protein [Trichomonas vaginalis G3]|uniref:Adaptin N terminal region family protein n=1 Tax=Trichomonas vaginalis (strain ATCC PRA-98 / G3) TaxID=412133 RepID=A2E936_TRIV3|nr:clathrin adaptor protein [Trichomonas vaginalis G3]EAY10830.1 Adaptin N terminal region family protein [Trichomonas vaginalis G3]KAI5519918.1 clathrin adaptor protein [Trichomonas vaginalis G3]|eukprot:XP_001323053.1 Adaptin N terminal region family protein [Trichomonas vaginalis G3]
MRGLKNLILEYDALDKVGKRVRAETEISKLKKVFSKDNIRKYIKKKSIAKICFLVLTGYEIRFGFKQTLELVEEKSYECRRIAWMMIVIYLNTYPECKLDFVPNLKKNLLNNTFPESANLALLAIASICTPQLVNSMASTIVDIAFQTILDDSTRKIALLTLSCMYQTSQQLYIIEHAGPRIAPLMKSRSVGVALSSSVLALTIVKLNDSSITDNIQTAALEAIVSILLNNEFKKEYDYKGFPSPFLLSNLFRILSYRRIYEDAEIEKMDAIVNKLLDLFSASFHQNKFNSLLMIFNDAFKVFVKIPDLKLEPYKRIITTLGLHLTSYSFCLECLFFLVETHPCFVTYFSDFITSLIKISKEGYHPLDSNALNLLFLVTTRENYQKVSAEMIPYIQTCPESIRESICKKIATIIQSFSSDKKYARENLLKIVEYGGQYSECIWGMVAQALLDDKENYKSVVEELIKLSKFNPRVPGPMTKILSHILGISCPISPSDAVNSLAHNFVFHRPSTQSSIVSSLTKITMQYPSVRTAVIGYLNGWLNTSYTTVLQRIKESLAVLTLNNVPQLKLSAPSHYVDTTINFRKDLPKAENIVFDDQGIEICADTKIDVNNSTAVSNLVVKNRLPKDLKIKKCDSICDKHITAEGAISKNDNVVRSGSFLVVRINFHIKGPFSTNPQMEMRFSGKKVCRFQVPVSIVSFCWPFDLTMNQFGDNWGKTKSKKLTAVSYLIVPDGDVITSIKEMSKKVNLSVVKREGDDGIVCASGYYKTSKGRTIGILAKFSFNENEMTLKCEVHTVKKKATSVAMTMIKKAFSYM